MSVSVVLEVVIGLSFLFATLSLLASGANELISSVLALRAKTLEKGVKNLLDGEKSGTAAESGTAAAGDGTAAAGDGTAATAPHAVATALYEHALIKSLYRSSRRLPSYIPSEKFALALLDNTVKPAVGMLAGDAHRVTDAIAALPKSQLKSSLDVLWRDARGDADAFRKGVETWFDQSMERVSGWYRRLVQIMLCVLGLAIAIVLNVNTVTVTQRLWDDAPLRAAVAEQAQKASPPQTGDQKQVTDSFDNLESGLKTVDGLALPIGWGKDSRPSNAGVALVGWILTALAISMGAPFWFDVLGRAARLRSTGVRVQTAKPQSAETESPRGGS